MNNLRNLLLWIVIAALLVFLFNLFQTTTHQANTKVLDYSQFITDVNDGQVKKATIQGEQIKGELAGGAPASPRPRSSSTQVSYPRRAR